MLRLKTVNKKWRHKAQFAICEKEKSTFIKAADFADQFKLMKNKSLIKVKELHCPVIKKSPK